MRILVTGAKGFVGKNLCTSLNNIKDGKDKTRPNLHIDEVFEYDIDSSAEQLQTYCQQADFVFNLAIANSIMLYLKGSSAKNLLMYPS